MTIAQLETLMTQLRSRPRPAGLDLVQLRARYEALAAQLGGTAGAQCEPVDAGGVPAEWVVPLPDGLSLYEAMGLGTSGLTAALAVDRFERAGLQPGDGRCGRPARFQARFRRRSSGGDRRHRPTAPAGGPPARRALERGAVLARPCAGCGARGPARVACGRRAAARLARCGRRLGLDRLPDAGRGAEHPLDPGGRRRCPGVAARPDRPTAAPRHAGLGGLRARRALRGVARHARDGDLVRRCRRATGPVSMSAPTPVTGATFCENTQHCSLRRAFHRALASAPTPPTAPAASLAAHRLAIIII